MPKLKTLKPLVASIKPLVGRMPGEKARISTDGKHSNGAPATTLLDGSD